MRRETRKTVNMTQMYQQKLISKGMEAEIRPLGNHRPGWCHGFSYVPSPCLLLTFLLPFAYSPDDSHMPSL